MNKEKKYLLSVIIPCYNAGKYLTRCLDSIFVDNEYRSLQVICINDGSTDNTLDILRRYESEYSENMLVFSHKNQGVSESRNLGLKHSTGEWVTFVDADDYITKDVISEIMPGITNIDENIDIIYLGYRRVSRSGDEAICTLPDRVYKADEKSDIMLQYDDMFFGSAWGKLFRLEPLVKSGVIFDKAFTVAEDSFFIYKYFPQAKGCMTLHNVIYNYIVNFDSATIKYHGISNYDNLRKMKQAAIKCVSDIEADPIILQKLQDRVNDRFVFSTLFAIYSIYRAKNRPDDDYKVFLVGWNNLHEYNDLRGGGVFKSRINRMFYFLVKIHPYAGHLFLKLVFGVERICNKLFK